MQESHHKLDSLQWAIGELEKQKKIFADKLSTAQKRDETQCLIEEVINQKSALDQRIASLENGLIESSQLVDEPVALLEKELSKVDDKIVIAQERLQTLEQEEYLADLGRKLSGEVIDETAYTDHYKQSVISTNNIEKSSISEELSNNENTVNLTSHKTPSSPGKMLMKSPPANRIETEEEIVEESPSRVTNSEIISKESKLEQCSPASIQNLEECANALGIEPDFLLDKGLQAVLRMIGRNGNKISFPLEVEQVENS